MSSIDKLSRVTTINASDLLALYSGSVGNDVAATLATLLTWLQTQIAGAGDFISQYESPTAGASVYANPFVPGSNAFVLMTPAGTIATATFYLPALAISGMGQEILVHSTQAITALTVNGNGASSVSGAPSSMAAGGFFRMRFDSINKSRYRIG
jgi:hypothetical protein